MVSGGLLVHDRALLGLHILTRNRSSAARTGLTNATSSAAQRREFSSFDFPLVKQRSSQRSFDKFVPWKKAEQGARAFTNASCLLVRQVSDHVVAATERKAAPPTHSTTAQHRYEKRWHCCLLRFSRTRVNNALTQGWFRFESCQTVHWSRGALFLPWVLQACDLGRPSRYDPNKRLAGVTQYVALCKQQNCLSALEGWLFISRVSTDALRLIGREERPLPISEQLMAAQASSTTTTQRSPN